MARAQRKRFLRLGSARKVRSAGILLGVLIMLSLGTLILQDRHARIEAATRQSQALALGADRLLHYEMRNLERAMDAALEAIGRLPPGGETDPPQFRRAVAGVLGRVSEFDSISLVDRDGRSLSGDADAADIPQWLPATGSERRLYLGTLWQSPEAGWLVPLAVPTPSGHWLIAQLKASELQKMIASLDTGREGSIAVIDRNGVVLAREGTPGTYVGRKIPLPPEALKAQGLTSMQIRSRLDAVIRLASFSAGSGYPMLIGAGIGLDEALAPWWRQACAALALVALYWVILVFMVRRLRTAETVRERMLDALAAQSEWLREAQEASRTGVWRIEPDQLRVHVSAHMAAMFGFPAVEATLPIVDFFARMHDDDRPMAEAAYAHARATGTPYVAQYRVRQPDGSVRWIKARGAVAMDSESDGHGLMMGTVIDVTEQHEARMRIEQGEIQFRALFERNPLPFWVFDEATLRFLAVNDAAIAAYGYSREEFLAMTILDIRPREDVDEVRASVVPEQSEHVEPVWRHVTRDGKRIEVQIHVNHIDFAGRRARLVLAEDVSERLAYERDLAWRAEHDTTTGLLTLPALVERLDAVSAAQDVEQPSCYAVAYVRLRDLEVVAPTLGRRAGENILCEAAARFREIGDAFGLVAYSPAESFVIAALDVTRRDALIARLMDATSQPVAADGGSHPLEAWIGVADGPCPVESAEQTVAHAALAALQARHDNQPVVHFDASMAEQAAERPALVGRLRRALHNREFELFFQPIRRIADGSTVAFEALLRWRQADGGYVPPVQFIPLCEASGLIVPIGAWVLEEAARAHGLLSAAGHGHIAIAVNVSAVQLLADSLADTMRGLRRKYDLPRGALHVELTESVVLHRPEAARALMRDLQAQGACISLDDFGTGFSSMAYLRDLPLDHLKIDRTFVRDVHEDERNASICRALIALGHGLGLGIVAEGVETEAQLAWLRAEGCDQVQGYLLGRPAPLDEVLAGLPRPALARRAG